MVGCVGASKIILLCLLNTTSQQTGSVTLTDSLAAERTNPSSWSDEAITISPSLCTKIAHNFAILADTDNIKRFLEIKRTKK